MHSLHDERPNARIADVPVNEIANQLRVSQYRLDAVEAVLRGWGPWCDDSERLFNQLRAALKVQPSGQPPAPQPSRYIGLQNAEPTGHVHFIEDDRAPGKLAAKAIERKSPHAVQLPCDTEPA